MPSNIDIMNILGRLEEKVDTIDTRLQFTNGKVAKLVEKDIRRDERERVIAEHNQNQPTIVTKEGDVVVQQSRTLRAQEKLYLAAAATLTAISAVLGLYFRSN